MRKQKAIVITIPQPCNESWDAMQPNNCGRFCSLCEKTVIDFTEMSDDEVVKIMTRPGQTPCGRFSETQLNRDLIVPDVKPEKPFLRLVSKVAASLLLLQAVFTNAFGQKQLPDSTTQSSVQKNDASVPAKDPEYISPMVSGTVINENNEPIAGASVKQQNTTIATITDTDGNFSIEVSGEKPVLEITYVGYLQQTITVTGSNQPYNISLELDSNFLNNITVPTFYGIPMSEERYTGPVSIITTQKLINFPVTNMGKTIEEGAAPGAQVTSGCAIQNDPPPIRMGGFNALNVSTTPLIILNDKVYKGNIAAINPIDVATMQILKDAEAKSLYGASGVNGVIVIVTKDYKPHQRSGLFGKHPKKNSK